jgi:biofilm PGA synthesis N-glycosyltransferase PgaC
LLNEIILIILICSLVIQLIFWLGFFARLAYYKIPDTTVTETSKPVSVVICARNEAGNLKNNLPAILGQDYEFFEVICSK